MLLYQGNSRSSLQCSPNRTFIGSSKPGCPVDWPSLARHDCYPGYTADHRGFLPQNVFSYICPLTNSTICLETFASFNIACRCYAHIRTGRPTTA